MADHVHDWHERQQGAGRHCPGCDTIEWFERADPVSAPKPLTPEDAEALTDAHACAVMVDASGVPVAGCPKCEVPWPCDAARLLAALDAERAAPSGDALREALAELKRQMVATGRWTPSDADTDLRHIEEAIPTALALAAPAPAPDAEP